MPAALRCDWYTHNGAPFRACRFGSISSPISCPYSASCHVRCVLGYLKKDSAMSRGSMSFGLGLESLESRQMFNGGALDTSFGGGVMTTPFNFDVQNSAVQADNKVVVVGTSAGGFTVGRLNANGTIDTTFGGGDGLVTTKFTQASTNIAQQVV